MKKFNFVYGDVIEFCDELFIVLANYGSTGKVRTLGGIDPYYINNFYWSYAGTPSKFVRHCTADELNELNKQLLK